MAVQLAGTEIVWANEIDKMLVNYIEKILTMYVWLKEI